MTGIHLMDSGQLQANLMTLNEEFQLAGISELVASKTTEKAEPADLDWSFHATQLDQLEAKLNSAFAESKLPESRDRQAVNELLIELRLATIVNS